MARAKGHNRAEVFFMAVDINRAHLLLKIQELSFVTVDLNLYLDTHPNDAKALDHYNKAATELQTLMKQYENLYGPLANFGHGTETGNTWRWINNPWPWDM